jgi:hypothetical protein
MRAAFDNLILLSWMINKYNRTSKDGVVLPISIPSVRSLVARSAVEYPAPGRQVLLTIKLNQLFSSTLENVHSEWLFQRMMLKERGREGQMGGKKQEMLQELWCDIKWQKAGDSD